jgi:uncharacterized membrane protein YfcA
MAFVWQAPVIFVAAFCAGMINSVAGGGTLVTFPTLVWLGRDPILANVTNAVALWPGSLSAAFGYRRELGDSGRWMLLLAGPSLAGGLLGASVLLRTPSRTFAAIVPYLILFATVLFALQESITRRLGVDGHAHRHASRAWWIGAAAFQFCVAVYGGYFGAGIGILMLAALGLLGLTDIHTMNGLKNLFAICINGIAAVYFAVSGAVLWSVVVVMAVGSVLGGLGGAGIAHRMGRTFVRRVVIVVGVVSTVALTIRLFV